MVTIRKVADQAGVSIGTVSRVLNNKPGVGQKTRQHVFEIADQLGYQIPRRITPIINSSKITHLGLLNRPLDGGFLSNPFFQGIFLGVDQVCQENQISLSFSMLDMENNQVQSIPPLLKDENVNGIVVVGALPFAVVQTLANHSEVPIILVDNCFPNSAWDSVMIDNVEGMKTATEALIAKNHQHIALLSGPDHPSIVERREGYKIAMQQHGLRSKVISPKALCPEDGEWGVEEILKTAPETTAIVCSNDMQAVGAIRKLQSLAYDIPADFSVTGFDDINITQFTSPPITTVQVDRIALGSIATWTLLERIRNPNRPVVRTSVGVSLIERESVSFPRCEQRREDIRVH